MKTVTMAIQKGGAGKTTVAYHLAHALSMTGKRILAIDLDPQGSMSKGFIAQESIQSFSRSIFDKEVPNPAPQSVRPNLSLFGSYRQLASIERSTDADTFWALKEYLDGIQDNYDFTLIDTPPSLGILPTCAMAASDGVIIPLEAEGQALDGMLEVHTSIANTKRRMNPKLTIIGHVLSNVNWSRAMSKEIHCQLQESLKASLFETTIGTSVRVAEAWSHHQTVFEYDPTGKGSKELTALAEEFTRRMNDGSETEAA